MARLETGEVLLTTRIGQIIFRVGSRVVAGDVAVSQLQCEPVVIQPRHPCGLAETQPVLCIQQACEFRLEAALLLLTRNGQPAQQFIGDFHGQLHTPSIPAAAVLTIVISPTHRPACF